MPVVRKNLPEDSGVMLPQADPLSMSPAPQMCIARALYDNIAESPDELAFRRGDQLTVLEQNTNGLEGWWLCSLRGRQGICPGNRLRLLAGVYETPPTTPTQVQPGGGEVGGKRRSWHVQSNRVVTPQRRGDVYVYEMPSSITRSSPITDCYDTPRPTLQPDSYDTPRHSPSVPSLQHSPSIQDTYNVPRHSPSVTSLQDTYNVPRHSPSMPLQQDTYNVPRHSPSVPLQQDTFRHSPSITLQQDTYNVPRHSPSIPLQQDTYNVPRHSPSIPLQQDTFRHSPSGPIDSYDVPRSASAHLNRITPSSSVSSLTADSLSMSSNRSSLANMPEYDVPRSLNVVNTQYDAPGAPKELPLELSAALDTLARLQTEVTCATTILLGYVVPGWREKEKLDSSWMDIKLSALRLKTALYDLVEFGEGALGNATKAPDKGIAQKIRPLVKSLREAHKTIEETTNTLDAQNWNAELLSRNETSVNILPDNLDSLDQLITCARTLTEDVRLTVSSIQGNATLLFKRTTTPPNENNNGNWMEDYDYVNLDTSKNEDSQNITQKDTAETVNDNRNEQELDCNDKQVVTFYAKQAVTYMSNLTNAIDAFLQTVERNQPPKIFLAYGKFVVLSAHRLVHIGDTVHRNVLQSSIKDRGLDCANALSEALAVSVNKTKIAAVQFPSVIAVQEMVDSIVDISYLASDLKLILLQASQV